MKQQTELVEVDHFKFCVLCGWGDAIQEVDIPNHGKLILCRRHWTPEKFEKQFNKQNKLFYENLPETIKFHEWLEKKNSEANLKTDKKNE